MNHGGLCLFYASFLSAREVPLPVYKSGVEVLAVYCRSAGHRTLAVVIYRPPIVSVSAFFDDLADVLERLSTFACPVILTGDVNIHLDVADDAHAIKWRSIIDSYGLVQHVTAPTHQQGHTLDVVVTRSDCLVADIQIEPPILSDHSYITFSVDLQMSRGQNAGTVCRRQWRHFDQDEFSEDLCQSDLLCNPPTDVVNLVTCYNDTLLSLLDKHAPFADIKRRAHENAPWYDRRCEQVRTDTRRLERAYRRNKTAANREAWRCQSKLLLGTYRQKYVQYWSETISANKNDSKALWSKVNVLLKTPQLSTSVPHSADDFAAFFRSKVDKIRQATAAAPPPVIDDRPCTNLSAFSPVTPDEISKIVKAAPSKHCSLDPVPTWLLKRLLPLLASVLADICNASFSESLFPDSLKQALVRPRLKKATLNPEDIGSFRPISNLSFLSKVVERAAAVRLSVHSESQQLLPSRQSAYRARHSTETAIIAVHDEIVKAIDAGEVCALVLLDLSAAFDTVDHSTLLQVLRSRFGVTGAAHSWCSSYLSQRSQTFCANAQLSGPHIVDCSVPQGSVLGPQKFSQYTEDLAYLITNYQLSYHLYADDTQLLGSTPTSAIQTTVNRLQSCAAAIHLWCSSRRLQLNPAKTELIWFGSRANLQKIATADLSLLIDGNVIHRVDSVRDLGVTLDSELTLQRHVNKVASLCFYHIRRLKQVCKLLGPGVATTLVSTFVLNRLDYCNAILAGLPKTTIAPLQRAQNAAARLVAQLGPRDHVSNALRDLHWLPVQQRITYKLCLLMHLVHNDRAPVYLADSVTATANISRRTRLRSASSLRYEQPRTRLKLGERGFAFAGPAAWNRLPLYIQEQSNTDTFKRHLKTFLFQQCHFNSSS